MAWSYEVSHAASTVSPVSSYAEATTSTQLSTATGTAQPTGTTGTWVSVSITASLTASSGHTWGTIGTAGAFFTFTGTVTGWHSWALFSLSSSSEQMHSSIFTSSFSQVHVIGTATVTWMPVQVRLRITQLNGSTSEGRLIQGTHLYREGRTTRLSVSEWFTNVTDTNGGTNTSSTEFTGETTFSQTAAFVNGFFYIYPSTTASSSANTTNTVTTSTEHTYTFPTTAGAGTTSTSSTLTRSTSTTLATTTSVLTFQYATITNRPLFETIWHLDSTDWGFKTTTTGDGQVTVVAASFTGDSTFSHNQHSYTLPTSTQVSATFSEQRSNNSTTRATLAITHTYTTKNTTSSTFSSRVTTQSTYVIGTPTAGAAMIPLTALETVTRRYTTTAATSLTWHSTTTSTYQETHSSWETLNSSLEVFTMSVSTTGGDPVSTYTTTIFQESYTEFPQPSIFNWTSISISTGANFRQHTVMEFGQTQSRATIGFRYSQINVSNQSADAPSFMKAAVAGGFQVWGAHGIGSSYGTNVSASPPVQVGGFGHIFPNVILPLLDQETRSYSVGTDPYTSRYIESASEIHVTSKSSTHATDTVGLTISLASAGGIGNDKSSIRESAWTIGGHGWKRAGTDFSQLSARAGIHSYTSYDSTGGSTASTMSWNPTSSTRDISHGNAINMETAPRLSLATTNLTTNNPIVTTYPAFPE